MFGFKRSMVQAVAILSWTLHHCTFGNVFLWFFFSTLLSIAVLLAITTYDHDYWINRGVFSPPAWPLVGHIISVVRFKEQGGMCFKRIYETYRNVRFLGTHQFFQRTLVICDPELIKRICVNDFQHFVDRGFFFNKDVDPLAGSVLFLRGNEWKRLRAKISPIFSPIKLRGMFPLIDNTAKDFVVRIKEILESNNKENSKENSLDTINFSNGYVTIDKSYQTSEEENESTRETVVDDSVTKENKVNFKIMHLHVNERNDEILKDNQRNQSSEKQNCNDPVYYSVVDNIDCQNSNVSKLPADVHLEKRKYENNNINTVVNKNINCHTSIRKESHNHNGKHMDGYKNMNGTVTGVETKITNGKIQSAQNNDIHIAKGKMFDEICKIKEEIKETRDVISAAVDSEKLVGGYTADAIVPCAFGLKSNVMYNDNDPFAVALQAFYEMSFFNIFEKTMRQFWPAFVLFFRMRIIPRKTHEFFYNIVTSVLRAREKGEQEKRGDFIDMMMALRTDDNNNNNKTDEDVEITDMVISANAFIIFLGGFETTSSTLAFLLLELAAHPGVQERMREEIQTLVETHGTISFELLHELTYMEMVIQETLRLYPPFPSIQRMCTKEYTLPGTSVVVEKGTIILFPTLGIQRDERYFENAESFIPERWREGSPQPPPGVYMPFGDGPRYCIGKRFAMIQMKCCLVRLLQHVRISPARESMLAERLAEPFAADPRSPLTLHPADSLVKLTML